MQTFETNTLPKINISNNDYVLSKNSLEEIEREVMKPKFGFTWGFHEEAYDRGKKNINETAYMVPGTLELIKRVVSATQEGEAYDTIVFLDKSARPAAHLYRKMIAEMKLRGILDPTLELPDIKFLDIGKTDPEWKIESAETPENIRAAIPPEIMTPQGENSRVLIVDEFRETGETLRVAKALFRNAYGVEAEGTYQFEPNHAPFWYKRINLTKDAAVFEGQLKLLKDPIIYETLGYLANNLPKDAFIALLEKVDMDLNPNRDGVTSEELMQFLIEREENSQRLSEYISKTDPEDMVQKLETLANMNLVTYPEAIYDIIKSHFGILTRPEEGSKDRNLELREMLDTLAAATVQRLKEERKESIRSL